MRGSHQPYTATPCLHTPTRQHPGMASAFKTGSAPGSTHEVVDIIVLGGGALVRHEGVRHGEAVVRGADALRVSDGLACARRFVVRSYLSTA